jgi:hypothetical protein
MRGVWGLQVSTWNICGTDFLEEGSLTVQRKTHRTHFGTRIPRRGLAGLSAIRLGSPISSTESPIYVAFAGFFN